MDKYKATIGLEVHAELKTKTKVFCSCLNSADEVRPNINVCPVCMGHPGTLPVLNKEAVKHVLKVGYAIGANIADFTEFDRKNYFYPDIPKGYQISQYKYPLVSGGELAGVKITRVHLEEDTARSTHDTGDYSLVDFNRAGLPLMELVTEPVIHSAEEASNFAKELQLLLRYLGAGDANMEKGEMRVEANISVSPESKVLSQKLGTKTEVKNLNSFKVVEKAIAYEIKRQIALLENGEKVIQETRGWDEAGQKTYSQRIKEDSHDYRYFPEPDLPKLKLSEISEFKKEILEKELGELPWQKRERLQKNFALKAEDAEIFVQSKNLADYFESVIKACKSNAKLVKLSANYILSDYLGLLKNDTTGATISKIPPENFAKLMQMVADNKLSSRGAKDTLLALFTEGGEPEAVATTRGLIQKSDEGELIKVVLTVLEANPNAVADYRSGKESALQFLIGQGMKATRGGANPDVLKKSFVAGLAQVK
ncbi:Asp-tRNA(Asn)/Glu-tRNA(Gln) amidotransferase subunit GatB [Patescibacteria group bacterium]|nr:MAG: Asp-tRNA(Asn)/Glu-tRNA(Gln) amidotransferase subunit GatB [Patescibacteria group bacterium]